MSGRAGLGRWLMRAARRLRQWLTAPRLRRPVVIEKSTLSKPSGNRYGAAEIKPGGSPLGLDPFG